jgi:hypothetical protein
MTTKSQEILDQLEHAQKQGLLKKIFVHPKKTSTDFLITFFDSTDMIVRERLMHLFQTKYLSYAQLATPYKDRLLVCVKDAIVRK